MMEHGKRDEVLNIIRDLYMEEYVDEVYHEYLNEFSAAQHQGDEPHDQSKGTGAELIVSRDNLAELDQSAPQERPHQR